MKKLGLRWAAGLLGVGLLLTGGVLAMSRGDSLISLSFLEKKYIPDMVEQGGQIHEEKFSQAYDKALEELSQVRAGESEGLYSPDLRSQAFQRGDQIVLETGAGFLMLSGQAGVSHNGAFIDVTTGEALEGNAVLTPGHRYLAGEDTTALIQVYSGLARAGVQGAYGWMSGGEDAAPFTDVSLRDGYYEAVDYVYFNQLFSGMGDDKFAPTSNMDRAMMMTVLYHLAGDPEQELMAATATFNDVAADKWYFRFVSWAAEQGVSAGTGDGAFSPTQPVTREQVIVLLYNFATNYMGMSLTERMDISGCPDYSQVAFWSADAVSWAAASGVIPAADSVALEPGRGATRAEVASMLMNFSQRYLD